MGQHPVLGGIVGGIILFFWGFVSHMLTPLGELGVHLEPLPNEESFQAAMKDAVREPGLYFVPGHDTSKSQSKEAMQAHAEKIANSPYGFMVIYPSGRDR